MALKQIRVSKFLEHDLPKAKYKLKSQETKLHKQIASMQDEIKCDLMIV
jgi:hypothetical protein